MIRYQRGSCYLKGKKQKMWYGVYRADVMTPNGPERQQIKVVLGTLASLPTKNAAQMKLSDIIHHQTVSVQPEDITYAELAKRWEQADGPSYDQTTREAYVNALRIYILPTFANRKIASITREGVQNFLNAQAKNYSRSTLATMKTMLKLTLGWAADSDLIRRNPCEGKLRVPVETGGRTIKRTILSPNQVVSIAQKLEEPYATLVLLLYFGGGVRIGEALELRDSDFNGCVVHISRKLYRGKVGKVKSKASNRTIKLPNWLVSKLLDLPRVGGSDLIFQSPVGTHLDPGTALARKVRPACVELGITIGGQHDFRHSMSNALRKAGTHPKVVAGILGHAKADLAVDTYDQTSLEERSEALASVTRLLPKVTQNAESPVN